MTRSRRRRLLVVGLVSVALLFGAALYVRARLARQAGPSRHPTSEAEETSHEGDPDEPEVTAVQTILPKHNSLFVRDVTAPAFVEAYYKADLFSEVAGPVKSIQINFGDFVSAGELLVEIDVPDLFADIARKEALIKQARAALNAARKEVDTLEATGKTTEKAIDEKQAELERETANRDFRKYRLTLAQEQVRRDVIAPERLEEVLREARVVEAAWKSAQVALEKARLDLLVVEARVETARAEIQVKQELIAVAQEDKKRAEAQAAFGRILAPFTGVIIARNVDPGSFVQNATTARTQPMLTLLRLDKVKVSMSAPERAAPYISTDVDAVIQMEASPGKNFHNLRGKVTRFAPFLDPDKGRTMRVEVDLYNPPERGYKRACTKGVSALLAPLGGRGLGYSVCTLAAYRKVWSRPGLLRPGMYGSMRLLLERFENAYVIPSGAVFSREGKTYMLQVKTNEQGKHVAQKVPVHVEMEDGIQAKVSIVDREAGPEGGDEAVLRPLTGTEELIPSGQAEISDGQEIEPARVDW